MIASYISIEPTQKGSPGYQHNVWMVYEYSRVGNDAKRVTLNEFDKLEQACKAFPTAKVWEASFSTFNPLYKEMMGIE